MPYSQQWLNSGPSFDRTCPCHCSTFLRHKEQDDFGKAVAKWIE